jgi:hypothetical protein
MNDTIAAAVVITLAEFPRLLLSGKPSGDNNDQNRLLLLVFKTALLFGRPECGPEITRNQTAAPQKKFGCKPLAWEGSENRT